MKKILVSFFSIIAIVVFPLMLHNILLHLFYSLPLTEGGFWRFASIWFLMIVVPVLWLVNNLLYAVMHVVLKPCTPSKTLRAVVALVGYGLVINAVYYSLATYKILSAPSLAILLSAGMSAHALGIFLHEGLTKVSRNVDTITPSSAKEKS